MSAHVWRAAGLTGQKGGRGGGVAAAEDVKFGLPVILRRDTVCTCDTAEYAAMRLADRQPGKPHRYANIRL